MSNRISSRTLYDAISDAITTSHQKILKLERGLGDGRAVRAPSDDPVRIHRAMLFREQIRESDQYLRNLDNASSQLAASDVALQQLQDVLGDLGALQASASDDSTGADGRRVMAGEVGDVMESLVSLANSRFSGRYLFGGTQTLTAPLVITRDAEGRVSTVNVNQAGVGGDIKRQFAPDVSLTINVSTDDLFGSGASFFGTLNDLRAALLGDDGEAIRSLTEKLSQAQDRVTDAETLIGSLMNRAETLQQQVQQDKVGYEDGRSGAEDLDMAQAAVDFQAQTVELQAALSAGSRILGISLLDYLK